MVINMRLNEIKTDCWMIAPEPHILLFKRKKEFTKMNPELIEKIKQEQQAKLNKELDKLDPKSDIGQ
jgi:hypothetical protein